MVLSCWNTLLSPSTSKCYDQTLYFLASYGESVLYFRDFAQCSESFNMWLNIVCSLLTRFVNTEKRKNFIFKKFKNFHLCWSGWLLIQHKLERDSWDEDESTCSSLKLKSNKNRKSVIEEKKKTPVKKGFEDSIKKRMIMLYKAVFDYTVSTNFFIYDDCLTC